MYVYKVADTGMYSSKIYKYITHAPSYAQRHTESVFKYLH